ncbi:Phosphatidylserine/phosphatidylglycerophosphate/cardiolipin synthase [Asanoa hainanensis]|uniref:Phosphatidylserine/phosphatidylglycerophosphate/cardiolipin synthase n=1 Tax=Asanoa hainanensis TaxID=560556 RepID=A0A239MZF0_9ACTN|nr:phospholipase D-like domain-containing protein [Asanoa hainanensis]SNT48147.1 Phosphatidylserine/phosphatidylglycerophosphate/cardiolipin synthase [Asanoa hainanensis]
MPDGDRRREELDLGAVTAPEGYFLLRQAPGRPFLDAPDTDQEYRHRFTYRDSTNSIRRTAIELIQDARHKIFLASFRIGDRELLEALFAAVDRLRGGVYVITSWTEQSLTRDLSTLEDIDEVDVQAQKKRFDELTRRGIALRGHEGCHAKFLVVDDTVALVSSANLETSALVDTKRKRATGENGVVIGDPAEVDRLARFFTRLWFAGCTWEALPGAEYALHRRTPVPSPVVVAPPAGGPGVIWTYDTEDADGPHQERGILAALHDVIGRARRELLLATFSLVGIRDRPELLLEPLRRAMAAHALDVRLLVRARNNMPGHRADTAALAELGVTIHGDSGTHAKGVIADGRYGALFSANFDAVHGVYSGVEVGTRLDGRPALAEARRYFRHAMEHADLMFAPAPTQRELDHGLGSRWRRPWPHGERLTVMAAEADWRRLVDAAGNGPVLWEEGPELRLFVRDVVATLRPARSAQFQLTLADCRPDAAARMRDWCADRPAARTSRPMRGCCPAILTRIS